MHVERHVGTWVAQLLQEKARLARAAANTINKPFSRGGVGVEVLEVFWEELWLHFFWPTFWLHCILYRTYTGGEAPLISKIQKAM